MIIDFSELSANRVYHVMTQSVIPRPVAWVLSENEDHSLNLAPFSYFSAVSSDPPLLMLSIGRKADGTPKDTRRNIVERGHFVVHIAHREMIDSLNESSRSLPAGESELSHCGLSTVEFPGCSLPRLTQCRLAMACELYRVEDITDSQAMILGRVKQVYVDDLAVAETAHGRIRINAQQLDPIARLGGDEFAVFGSIRSVPRPK